MRITGLGDTGAGGQDCGANPCTWLDAIYAGWGSSECLPYLACMNPNDPRVVGALQSVTTSVATDIGAGVGAGVGAAASNLGTSTNIPGYLILAAVLVGIAVLKK